MLKTSIGTPSFMAPEIHLRQPYGKAVDVFALGVCLFTMVMGCRPFEQATSSDKLYLTLVKQNKVFWNHYRKTVLIPNQFTLSTEFIDLMEKMLAVEPTLRISVEDIFLHPWLSDQIESYDV